MPDDGRDLDLMHREHHPNGRALLPEGIARRRDLLDAYAASAECGRDPRVEQPLGAHRLDGLAWKTARGIDVVRVRRGDRGDARDARVPRRIDRGERYRRRLG